jgi:hypothetical protein
VGLRVPDTDGVDVSARQDAVLMLAITVVVDGTTHDATCTEIARTVRPDVKSFGSAPQIVELHLDGGAIIELAGPTEAPLLGPFAARAGSTTTIATALDPANVPHD